MGIGKKTMMLYITIISTLILMTQCRDYYYLLNLDKKTSENSLSSISSATQAIGTLSYEASAIEFSFKSKAEAKTEVVSKFLLKENYSVIIDSMRLYYEDKELVADKDYFVLPFISPHVIPNNYYEGYSNTRYITNAQVLCLYANLEPNYKLRKIDTTKWKYIINSKNYNFGLIDGKIIPFAYKPGPPRTIDKLTFSVDTSKITDTAAKEKFKDVETKKFKQLFLLKSFYYDKIMFAAVEDITSGQMIYVFLIEDKVGMTVYADSYLSFGTDDITQIGINKDSIFIANTNGFFVAKKTTTFTYENIKTFDKEEEKSPKDLLVNDKTVYVIYTKGLFIYDLVNATLTKKISHTHFAKLDYVTYDSSNPSSPYYVGIAVDNNPDKNIPEILIELIASGDYESNPKINRVYSTGISININDMTTDTNQGYSYIFDREKSMLYMLTRGVPNIENTFSYSFDLSKEYAFNPPSVVNNDYVSLLSVEGGQYTDEVAIMDNNGLTIFEEIVVNSQTLHCSFNTKGEYKQTFYIDGDCSYPEAHTNRYIMQSCKTTFAFDIDVSNPGEANLIAVWVTLIVVLVGIIATVLTLYFCRCCCFKTKKSPTGDSTKQVQSNHNEMVEVQIDSKI